MNVLLDNSAWTRFDDPRLPTERVTELAAAMETGRLATSMPFLLEAGFSARNAAHHDGLMTRFRQLPHLAFDADAETLALDAQRALARIGHHRLPPIDVMTAALAGRHGLGVLHYDRDYDLLREHTALDFESVWLAPAGSL